MPRRCPAVPARPLRRWGGVPDRAATKKLLRRAEEFGARGRGRLRTCAWRGRGTRCSSTSARRRAVRRHVGRHGRPCVVAFGRGEVVHQPVHLRAAVLLEPLVELLAGLAVELHAAVIIKVSHAQHLVDGGQIPPLAEVAAPFERGIVLQRTFPSAAMRAKAA